MRTYRRTGTGERRELPPVPSPLRVPARWLTLALFGLGLTAPGAAQPILRLKSWTGVGELRFNVQQQDSESLFAGSSMFDRQVAEESVALRNTLTVVSPRFLSINFGVSLGLLQSQLAIDAGEDSGRGALQTFDVAASYRPLSQHPVNLLWNRSSHEVPVEFSGVRRLDNESLGATAAAGPRVFPGLLALRQFEIVSESDFDLLVRGIDQRRRSLSYDGSGAWDRHRLFASLSLEDVDDRITPTYSHKAQILNLNHQFEILAPKLATLRSNLRYFDRSGDLSSSSLYLDEELRLQHRRSFSTSYRYLDREVGSFSGPASRSQSGFVGLHHTLYQSLDSNLLLARTRSHTLSGRDASTSIDELGFNSTYRKKTFAEGQLNASLVVRYEDRDNRRGDGQELVPDERHIARLAIPIRLERPGVLPGTVVVTDELQTTIYGEGLDYELATFGELTEITPLVGGLIREGQVILVEYRVEAPVLSRFTSLRDAFQVSLSFGWVEPFWRYNHIEYDLIEGRPSSLLTEQRDESLGVRFRVSGRRVDFVSLNERRTFDSQIQAYESLRSGQGVTYRPSRRWTLRLSLAGQKTDFTVPLRETTAAEGRLSLRWMPRAAFSIEAYGNAREATDTASSDQYLERYGLEGRWTFGKVTLLATVERWRRERTLGDVLLEDFSGLTGSFRFSRRFFPGRLDSPRAQRQYKPWPADLPGLWADPALQETPGEDGDGGAEAETDDESSASLAPATDSPTGKTAAGNPGEGAVS